MKKESFVLGSFVCSEEAAMVTNRPPFFQHGPGTFECVAADRVEDHVKVMDDIFETSSVYNR